MNVSKNLMTGLIGFALLAVPVAAAAKDNDRGGERLASGAGAIAFK